MKKILLLCAMYLASFPTKAQEISDSSTKTTYLSLGLSFNPIGAYSSGFVSNNINVNNNQTQNIKNYSYGKSIGIHSSYGLYFLKNIGAEIGLSYSFGLKNSYNEVYYNSSDNVTTIIEGRAKANNLSISPKLVFKLDQNKSGGIAYAKIGYQIGNSEINYHDEVSFIKQNNETNYGIYKWKLTGGPVHGSVFCVGYHFKENVKTKSKVFIELEISNASIKPIKEELVSSSINGVSNTQYQTENYKTILYKDEITYATTNNTNVPRERLALPLNFSYIGLKIGLVLRP